MFLNLFSSYLLYVLGWDGVSVNRILGWSGLFLWCTAASLTLPDHVSTVAYFYFCKWLQVFPVWNVSLSLSLWNWKEHHRHEIIPFSICINTDTAHCSCLYHSSSSASTLKTKWRLQRVNIQCILSLWLLDFLDLAASPQCSVNSVD